jgi:hypothetical protein
VHWVKNSAAWVLLGFLLTVWAGQASSFAHRSGQRLKSAAEHDVFQAALSVSSSRSFLDACTCCAELSTDSAHSYGRETICCGNGTSAEETAESGCGRCPANDCGGCCGHEVIGLFLSESVSRIPDPGRLPPVPPEDWSAIQRSLRPLLQPPRGV